MQQEVASTSIEEPPTLVSGTKVLTGKYFMPLSLNCLEVCASSPMEITFVPPVPLTEKSLCSPECLDSLMESLDIQQPQATKSGTPSIAPAKPSKKRGKQTPCDVLCNLFPGLSKDSAICVLQAHNNDINVAAEQVLLQRGAFKHVL